MSECYTTKPSVHIYDKLSNQRKHIAWTARLTTRHCSLNQYLKRFNIIEDATCKCGEGKETIKHFLLVYPRYERERDKLRKKVGMQGMNIEKLLRDTKMIKDTMKFVEDTKRFNFQGALRH